MTPLQAQRLRTGFTLVEVIASLFILAIAAGVCIAVISNRDTKWDKTAALNDAPAAMDAFDAAFDAEDLTALSTALALGDVFRLAYRVDAGDEVAQWCVIDPAKQTEPLASVGPLFVARLSNGRLYDDFCALEFDVALGWIVPGLADETAVALRGRLDTAAELCLYRTMILRSDLIEK